MPPRLTPLKMLATAAYLLAYPCSLLWLSGDWRWAEGWIFAVWFVALCAGTTVYLFVKNPDLLAERYRRPGTGGQAGWDQWFILAILILFLTWFVVMPLDARRFQWTTRFPFFLKAVGAALLALSSFFLFRAFSDNTFLSPLVRIQAERQQRVVSTGVYGFVLRCTWAPSACSSARRCS
jgi:protein-S-isoprenylcysteine O-methyltransferase Ste14